MVGNNNYWAAARDGSAAAALCESLSVSVLYSVVSLSLPLNSIIEFSGQCMVSACDGRQIIIH